MFVRIKGDTRQGTFFTECRQMNIHEEGPGYVLFVLRDKSFERRILVDKTEDEVYISNNEGKTIDSYSWDMEDTGHLDLDGNRILSHTRVKVKYPKDTERVGIVGKRPDGDWAVNFGDISRDDMKPLSDLPRYNIEVVGSGEPA